MSHRQRILVVAQEPKVAERLTSWALAAGYDVWLETTFAGGRARLDMAPDLLVAEVKLGEYNGLHLALRAHSASIPSIVIGPADPVLVHEAKGIGALYLQGTANRHRFLVAVHGQLPARAADLAPSCNRWPVTTVAAEADLLWRAFSDASWPNVGLGRSGLPN